MLDIEQAKLPPPIPESKAINAADWAYSYRAQKFERITITPKTIAKLDEAVVFMQGKEKWHIVENFDEDIDVSRQPAQVLKKVPLLTIFSDYEL